MLVVNAMFAAETPNDSVTPFQETAQQHDARMQWFRDAKFGMFIHWGLYSQLAGEWKDQPVTGGAEWIQNYLQIPSSQYSPLAKTWNPSKYNAREWVRLMKAAGIKYICITTKHHDGFCL
jgi:alpha-L-fucosidase